MARSSFKIAGRKSQRLIKKKKRSTRRLRSKNRKTRYQKGGNTLPSQFSPEFFRRIMQGPTTTIAQGGA